MLPKTKKKVKSNQKRMMEKNRGNKKGTKYKGKKFLDINQNGQKHKTTEDA